MKKVALITGSSRGIGRACAETLARRGYAVCINYIKRRDKAEQLRDALLRAHAVRARNKHGLLHTGKVGRKQASKAADIGHNARDHGALDVLFHQLDALVAGLDIHAGVTVALGKTTHSSFSPLH